MVLLRGFRFWRIRRRYAAWVSVSLCVFGLVPSARGQADHVLQLIGQLNDNDTGVRQNAVSALCDIKDPRAVEVLISAVKQPDLRVQHDAARALAYIKDPRAVSVLLAALSDRETAVIAGAVSFFIGRGEAGSEDTLIEVLNKIEALDKRELRARRSEPLSPGIIFPHLRTMFGYSEEEMADYFLNCGNPKLQEAGRAWVERTGYPFGHRLPATMAVGWGSERVQGQDVATGLLTVPSNQPEAGAITGLSRVARNEAEKNVALAQIDIATDDNQAALQKLNLAIRLDPSYAEAWRLRGSLRLALEDFGDASEDFDEAIRLDSTSAVAYRGRCFALQSLSKYRDAIQDCSKAIALNPEYADAFRDRGMARLMLAQQRDASGCADIEKAKTLAVQQQAADRQNQSEQRRSQRSIEQLFGSNSDRIASMKMAALDLIMQTLCK